MTEAGFNAGLGFARSYYAATAAAAPTLASLEGETRADVCVVGGGCTGLSAALHLAQAGVSVVLLEGGRVGWGASGRNGGQIIPGLRLGPEDLIARFGLERAKILFDLSISARTLVLDLIARHDIACDLKLTGHLSAAVHRRDVEAQRRELDALHTQFDYPHARRLGAEEVAGEVVGPRYRGGLLDALGGHLHPLNYTLGLAQAARAAGAQVFERSAATRIEPGPRVRVHTAQGVVTADHVVLAGDALLAREVAPNVVRTIMPVANFIVATAPLADPASLIVHDRAVSDSRFVVNYYRMSADGRLLFGGGERYSAEPPADIAAFAGAHMRRVFPQLAATAIDHAWGGLVSITRTRLPHLGRTGPIWFAHGYSGLGAVLSTLAGRLLAQAIGGDTADFDRFAAIAPPPMPGGDRWRGPLHTLGMLYYAMRDRL